jgi:hypothetical protein
MNGAAPDTGGVDIGPMGNVGGSIPGFSTVMRVASRTPEWAELGNQWKMAKDFNDSPAHFLAGSSSSWGGTKPVYGPPGGFAGAAADLGDAAAF